MATDRLDFLSENEPARRLAEARRSLEELRNTPQIFGSRSVRPHRVFSQDAYDIEVEDVGFDNRILEVTFTPDDLYSGLGGVLDFQYTMVVSDDDIVLVHLEALLPEDGITKWRLYLSGSDFSPPSWARFKFFLFANAAGTMDVQLL